MYSIIYVIKAKMNRMKEKEMGSNLCPKTKINLKRFLRPVPKSLSMNMVENGGGGVMLHVITCCPLP